MNNEKLREAYEKELNYIRIRERKLQQQAMTSEKNWKSTLEGYIPEKVYVNLQAAFAKAFEIIFDRGVEIIEKTYSKEDLIRDFEERDASVSSHKARRKLMQFRENVSKTGRLKSIITTAEGVGLGALGIGLPDIVFFIGFVLQSVYETALRYGYDYDRPEERIFILKMLEASVQKREKWIKADMAVEEYMKSFAIPDPDDMQAQIGITADAFALDMLVMKFIQGLPVVGVIGGLSNPVYYNRIMEYVRLKYHKRYLLEKKEEAE
ncbi:MAG: EcsC family protein [Lentihominibacter sp.]